MKKKLFLIISFLIPFICLVFFPSYFNPFTESETSNIILYDIRLPRILTCLLIGASLGASGAVLQAIFKNPLADPYILGISSGAALLAVLGLAMTTVISSIYMIPLLAFLGALLTGLAVGLLAIKKGRLLPERLLLAGIGMGFLLTSMLMFVLTVATSEKIRRAMLWVYGDLSASTYDLLPITLVLVAFGMFIIFKKSNSINALVLGDESAFSLGFNPEKERIILFSAVSLITGVSVAIGGIIGFIGLLMPHIVRFIAGANAKLLIPLSALAGAVTLCIADTIGKTIISPVEIPAGIVTALLGAPYFLYLLKKKDILGK